MTPPTKQEAETQARELLEEIPCPNCICGSVLSDDGKYDVCCKTCGGSDKVFVIKSFEELTSLIIQARERDAFLLTIDNARKEWERACEERNSLREKLELAQGELTKLENNFKGAVQAGQELLKERDLAQADCAVKYEALKTVTSFMGDVGKQTGDYHYDIALNALSTNPGQSLLDELKLVKAKLADSESTVLTLATLLNEANEKVEALDWLEDIHNSIVILNSRLENVSLLHAITQARKEQEK